MASDQVDLLQSAIAVFDEQEQVLSDWIIDVEASGFGLSIATVAEPTANLTFGFGTTTKVGVTSAPKSLIT